MAQQPPANSAAAVPIVPIVQPQPLQPPLSAFYPPYYNSHQAGNGGGGGVGGGGGGQLDPHLNLANDLRLVYQHNSYTDRLARATRNVYDQVRTSSSCVVTYPFIKGATEFFPPDLSSRKLPLKNPPRPFIKQKKKLPHD